jgi:hypothetical protein
MLEELSRQRVPNAHKMRGDLVSSLSLPPATQQLLHTYRADIQSMRLWQNLLWLMHR